MQRIERLSPTAVDYLISFDAHAVAISPTGYVYTTANPAGASRAWWCRRDDAMRVAKAAFASGDVEAIAKRLRISRRCVGIFRMAPPGYARLRRRGRKLFQEKHKHCGF
jgi:hypothetical protein